MPFKKLGYPFVFIILLLLYFSVFSSLTATSRAADKSVGFDIIYTGDIRGMIYPCA